MVRLRVVHRHQQPRRRGTIGEAASTTSAGARAASPAQVRRRTPAASCLRSTAPAPRPACARLRHQRARGIGEDQVLELGDRLARPAAGRAAARPAPAPPRALSPAPPARPRPGTAAPRRPASRLAEQQAARRASCSSAPPCCGGRVGGQLSNAAAAWAVSPCSSRSSAWPSAGLLSVSMVCSKASSVVRRSPPPGRWCTARRP